jgi:hypothetical protein
VTWPVIKKLNLIKAFFVYVTTTGLW